MVIKSAFEKRLSENHQCQGLTNHCGPYCTAMIINTLQGLQINGLEIAAYLNDPKNKPWYAPLRRIPNSATFPWGITAVFEEYGIQARWQILTPFNHLKALLSQQKMIIVLTASLRPVYAHYRILVTIKSNSLGFVDPMSRDGNIQFQARKTFLSQWLLALHTVIVVNENK